MRTLAGVLLTFGAATSAQAALPPDIENTIRKGYFMDGAELRYVDGAIDLNGDGKDEIIVYVVGGGSCGTGGCTTLVFTPTASEHRLVSSISVTRVPIWAATKKHAGWRDLIVSTGGGGLPAGKTALAFNGKTYPENPTADITGVSPGDSTGATLVVKQFASFEEAKPLAAAVATATKPSFDCSKATHSAEKMVCSDAALADLDRQVNAVYGKAMKGSEWPEDYKTKARGKQRDWLASRNACSTRACVESSYQRRLIELQITGGALEAPKAVGYVCKGHESTPFTAAFYNQTNPSSVVVTFGDRQDIAFAAPSGSGTRYTTKGLEFWEHQGEATVKWTDTTLVCRVVR